MLAEAYSDMGVAQWEAGSFREAADSLNLALALEPGNPKFLWNKSLYLLAMGEFAEGWQLYESRFPEKGEGSRDFGWLNREDLENKTVHIWAEQGLGDTIQFSRYALVLQARGAKVTFHTQDRLARLLSRLGPEITVASPAPIGKDAAYAIPLLSLPLAFGTSLDSVPAAIPYLHPEAEKVREWKEKLGSHGFKIGVAWQGTIGTKLAAARSFPLTCLEDLGRLAGVRLISLQKEYSQSSSIAPNVGLETLAQFDAGGDAFLDTAGVIQNLDLVISSDTAIAHLAGALGRDVWVALKQVPDWRWLLDRDDSPWYPTMRLFRQKEQGGWGPVFLTMRRELEKKIRASGKSEQQHAGGSP